MKHVWYVSLILFLFFTNLANAKQIKKINICDILKVKNYQKLSGKLIMIQAELSVGRHGVAIFQGGGNCKVEFRTADHVWVNAMHLVSASSAILNKYPGIADGASIKIMEDKIKEIFDSYHRPVVYQYPYQIFATFIGVIHTREYKHLALYGSASGFGDQGMFPLELEYIAVKDFKTIPNSRNYTESGR